MGTTMPITFEQSKDQIAVPVYELYGLTEEEVRVVEGR